MDALQHTASFKPGSQLPTTSLQQGGFAILFFMPCLALVVLSLRIFSRLKMNQFEWDDSVICVAMVLSIAETGAGYMGMRTAFLGVHTQQFPQDADRGIGMLWNFVGQILYNPILAIVKSSVLLFMLRVGGHQNSVRLVIHALNVLNITLAISIFVTVIFQCTPISYFWQRMSDPNLQGKCIDTAAFYVVTAALTILTDMLVLALPFWMFMGLRMARKLKIAIIGIFMSGALVTIIGVLRLAWLVDISYSQMTGDYSYDIRFVYSAVETNLAIITACAPALRPLIVAWSPKFFSTTTKGATAERSYGNKDGKNIPFDDMNMSIRGRLQASAGKQQPQNNSSFGFEYLKKGTSKSRETSPSGSEDHIMRFS